MNYKNDMYDEIQYGIYKSTKEKYSKKEGKKYKRMKQQLHRIFKCLNNKKIIIVK